MHFIHNCTGLFRVFSRFLHCLYLQIVTQHKHGFFQIIPLTLLPSQNYCWQPEISLSTPILNLWNLFSFHNQTNSNQGGWIEFYSLRPPRKKSKTIPGFEPATLGSPPRGNWSVWYSLCHYVPLTNSLSINRFWDNTIFYYSIIFI